MTHAVPIEARDVRPPHDRRLPDVDRRSGISATGLVAGHLPERRRLPKDRLLGPLVKSVYANTSLMTGSRSAQREARGEKAANSGPEPDHV